MTGTSSKQESVILFDGCCNLCHASVNFVLQHERIHHFKFASIQSKAGHKLLEGCGLPATYMESVLLIDRGKLYSGSTAALKIGQTLKFPWSILSRFGLIVPTFLRDWVYHQIATRRYQWFGKRDVCMVPTESLRSRFL